MAQLEPQEKFVLFRGLENHLDDTTFYVRAIIRNAKTAALLDTVDLDQDATYPREFSKIWEVPVDTSGAGLWITIAFSVYTDSGYTTKSNNYGDRYEEHLILHRAMDHGGGGADVNYKKIQKMIDESVKGIKFPKQEKVDLQPVLSAVRANKVVIPEAKEVDLSQIHNDLASMKTSITDLLIRPKFEKTDISTLVSDFHSLSETIMKMAPDKEKEELTGILEKIKTFFEKDMEIVKENFKEIKDFLDKIEFLVPQKSNVKQKIVKADSETEEEDFITKANQEANG